VFGMVWSLAAYAFGVWGLSRARTGSEGDWFRPIIERWSARAREQYAAGSRRRPFRSAFAAQLWHEYRRNAMVMPLLMTFVALPMFVMLSLMLLDQHPKSAMTFGSTLISPQMLGLAVWIIGPFFATLTFGASMAKFDVWGKIPMPAFFATRPLTTSQFLLTKFCSTAISVIATWVFTFGLFAVWAALEASSLNAHRSIIRAALAEATPRTIAGFVFALFGLVALTWRNLVSGMWPTLLGRRPLSTAIGFAFMAAFALVGIAGMWIYEHPACHAIFFSLLHWLLGSLITLKLAVAVRVSLALVKRGLIGPKQIRSLAIGWLVLAGCLFGGLTFLFAPTWRLAEIVVLEVPYPSFAAAALALDWNRHR
jgi:hypothetical protein